MKKMKIITICMTVTALALAATACSSSTNSVSEAGSTANRLSTDAAASSTVATKTYENSAGFKLSYNPDLIDLKTSDDDAVFYYKDGTENNFLYVYYCPEKQAKEALTSCFEDTEDSLLTRSEEKFKNDWSYSVALDGDKDGSGIDIKYTSIEHNEGAIVFQTVVDEKADVIVKETFEEIMQSLEYTGKHEQKEFDYVIGKYKADDKKASGPEIIVLDRDHTGNIDFPDTGMEIEWSSTNITNKENNIDYEYTIEGDALYIKLDGKWLSYTKTAD